MSKLKIKQLTIQNFRSFGDYPTIIKLEKLGPVLIIGMNEDDPTKTNGVGKSTIADAIIWVLFGRLPGNKQSQITPGDWVVNEKTNERCSVKLETEDRYIIERTRKWEGHNDLIITDKDGNDISKSTNKTSQEQLNKLFNLDYDIFTNSIFFAQSSVPFLELPDQKRKKALERMLNLSKFDQYAIIAKEKLDQTERKQIQYTTEVSSMESEILKISHIIEKNVESKSNWETERENKISEISKKFQSLDKKYSDKEEEIMTQISKEQKELDQIETSDIDGLRKSWSIYEKNKDFITEIEKSFIKLENEIKNLQTEKINLESMKDGQDLSLLIADLDRQMDDIDKELDGLPYYSIENLKRKWIQYEDQLLKEEDKANEVKDLEQELVKIETELKLKNDEIAGWKQREGKTCKYCRQQITSGHIHKIYNDDSKLLKEIVKKKNDQEKLVDEKKKSAHEFAESVDKLEPKISVSEAESANKQRDGKIAQKGLLQKHKQDLQKRHSDYKQSKEQRQARIKEVRGLIEGKTKVLKGKKDALVLKILEIEKKKPTVTVNEALLLKQQYDQKLEHIEKLRENITKLGNEKEDERKTISSEIKEVRNTTNPYQQIIDDLKVELDGIKKQKKKVQDTVSQFDDLIRHISYIYRAYSDRRRIRSFVMSQLIPFFNTRIAYYLDTFECDFRIEFNSFLQTKSDKWPYELWSGGQKRRIDLAIMMAIHDLHESIYDKQCNVLVFDEYDRSLDESGIYSFVNLLFKDFSGSDQTILIISHNQHLQDMFPTKIMVKLSDNLSHIEDIG